MTVEPSKLLAIYARDLLQQPEGEVVVLGRANIDQDDLTSLRIAIDANGIATPMNTSEQYDGDAEEMTHAQQWKQSCVINFYGDGAWQEAQKLILLNRSQTAYELQRDSGLSVFLASSITDVKMLTGEKFSNRFELAVNVQYTLSVTETVLRIDEAQFTTIED
ncbi:phage neck terminator protein [Pseudoalteromonas sp.]|uniref:phage neck terminator protein n=1 Tax=Pseudoalteromonas sp. TaxID=53249 RepID=UPI003D138DA7